MFTQKKRLASAIALAVVASTATAAPTFDWTPTSYSTEGAKTGASFTAPTVKITMGAEYAKDDLIEFAYSSKFLSTYSPPGTLTAYKKCTDGASPAVKITGDASNNGGTMTLGLISSTTTSKTYRITATNDTIKSSGVAATNVCNSAVASLNTTIGAVVSVGSVVFDGPAVNAAQALTGTYKATLSNGVTDLDGGSQTISDNGASPADLTDDVGQLITFATQYQVDASATSATALFNGIVDVAATPTRTKFDGVATDILTIDIDEAASAVVTSGGATDTFVSGTPADTEVVTAVITGDWSFLADENTTTTGIQNDSVVATCDGTAAGNAATETFAADGTSVTVACPAGKVGNIVVTYTTANNGTAPLNAISSGAYTMGASMTFEDSGTDLAGTGSVASTKTLAATGTSAGAFTLNGSTSKVQAYPVGAAVEQFLWVTNAGSNDGAIVMTATQGGATTAECSLGTAAGKSLTSVSSLANDCLTAAGITSGRAQLALTVNAAAALVNVYAAYKVTSADDRLALTVTDGITD
jgi:hypothetical protein